MERRISLAFSYSHGQVRKLMTGTADDAPVAERALQGRPRSVRDPRTPRLAEDDVRSEERAVRGRKGSARKGREAVLTLPDKVISTIS